MKKTMLMTAALWIAGCGGSDICHDTYSYGRDGNRYETDCAEPAESDPAERARIEAGLEDMTELASGECLESYTTRCSSGEGCEEVYERACQGGEGSVPPTAVGQLSQGLLITNRFLDNGDHTVGTLRPLTSTFVDALFRINENFAADDADIGFSLRGVSARGAQGTTDIRSHEVGTVDPDDPNVAGRTVCQLLANNIRSRCSVEVFRDTIEEAAADIGADPFDVERVTVMHEFGHTMCLEHVSVDSSAQISAMNSFHLVDNSRDQADYFRFLGSERDEVRSIILNP